MKPNEVVDYLESYINCSRFHNMCREDVQALTTAIRVVELLPEIKEYIESTHEMNDGEWGNCRTIEELINDDAMPDLWYKICELLGEKAKELSECLY